MKKTIILLAFIIASCNVMGQRLSDFTNAWQKDKIAYDENFTPILTLRFKNIANKIITTIEILVEYENDIAESDFSTRRPIISRTLHASIAPNQIQAFTVILDKDPLNRRPKRLYLNRVRYSDGSICDR